MGKAAEDMGSMKSYTSLKDLLPLSSPTGISWDEIPIKNKLVKEAASVYLRPMSSSLKRKNLGFFKWLGSASSNFQSPSNSDCVYGCGCLEFVLQIINLWLCAFGFSVKANSGRGENSRTGQ